MSYPPSPLLFSKAESGQSQSLILNLLRYFKRVSAAEGIGQFLSTLLAYIRMLNSTLIAMIVGSKQNTFLAAAN